MARRWMLPVLGALVTLALGASPAGATTLVVNTTNDETTPGDGHCSLREAIQAVDSPGSASGDCAAAALGANTIALASGRYKLTSGGELKIALTVGRLTIAGAGESKTVLDASSLNDRVLDIPTGPSVVVADLTIAGGHAPAGAAGAPGGGGVTGGAGGAGSNGGAILNAGSLTLLDVSINSSRAGDGGTGGIAYTYSPTGDDGGPGGAGGDGGAVFNSGTLSLTGVTLVGDVAGNGGAGGTGAQGHATGGTGGAGGAGGAGGGIASDAGTVTIDSSTLSGDTAGSGGRGGDGGQYLEGTPSSRGGAGGNGGSAGPGGAIWSNGGTVAVTNSTFVSNATGTGGSGGTGGVGGTPAGSGGMGGNASGGGAVSLAGGTVKLVNATLAVNSLGAAGTGGSGGLGSPNGPAGAAGASASGGGVSGTVAAPISLQNTLLALNAGSNCTTSGVLDAGHNLSFGGTGCPASFASGDPNLGALNYNGGPTQTIGLLPGSAAIDQIPAGAGCPATDQRGLKRPYGPACDIGAYEVTAPTPGAVGRIVATGRSTATVTVTATANTAGAKVWIEYGRTPAYGLKSTVATISGVSPSSVSLRLSRLNLTKTYHYRVVVASTDGTTMTHDARLLVPVVGSLRASPRSLRTGQGPVTLTYTDTLKATTSFVVLVHEHGVMTPAGKCVARGRGIHGRACQWVVVATFVRHDRKGRNHLRWNVRVGGHRLPPGRYRIQATPSSGRVTGPSAVATLTITR